jgi:hypothetical protein
MTSEKKKESKDNLPAEESEARSNRIAAVASFVYSLLVLAFFSWLLFDIWSGRCTLPGLVRYDHALLNSPTFRLIAFTVIGGGLGGVVNGIRSCLMNYNGFERRYTLKYLAAPWTGATLALFVYAIIRSSIAVFGGGTAANNAGTPQALANFAAGALAGYGSKDVFIWLDAQVQRLFHVPQQALDVRGKTEEAAVSRIHSANLELGQVTKVEPKDEREAGTVIDQAPDPDAVINRGDAVDIVVAHKPGG